MSIPLRGGDSIGEEKSRKADGYSVKIMGKGSVKWWHNMAMPGRFLRWTCLQIPLLTCQQKTIAIGLSGVEVLRQKFKLIIRRKGICQGEKRYQENLPNYLSQSR